jgi:hypothetical protein
MHDLDELIKNTGLPLLRLMRFTSNFTVKEAQEALDKEGIGYSGSRVALCVMTLYERGFVDRFRNNKIRSDVASHAFIYNVTLKGLEALDNPKEDNSQKDVTPTSYAIPKAAEMRPSESKRTLEIILTRMTDIKGEVEDRPKELDDLVDEARDHMVAQAKREANMVAQAKREANMEAAIALYLEAKQTNGRM